MPELDPGRTWSVTDLKKIATGAAMLTPLDPRHSALRWVRSDDGFGVYATRLNEKSDEACSVVFAFKTGEVWAIDALLLSAMVHDGQKFIPDLVPLAAVAERAPSLQRTAPSWRAKVPCSGRRRFTDGFWRMSGHPAVQQALRGSRPERSSDRAAGTNLQRAPIAPACPADALCTTTVCLRSKEILSHFESISVDRIMGRRHRILPDFFDRVLPLVDRTIAILAKNI